MRSIITEEQKNALYDIGVDTIETVERRKIKDVRNLTSLLSNRHSIFYHLYYDELVKEKLNNLITRHAIQLIQYESYYTGFYLSAKNEHKVKQVYGSENIEYQLYEQFIKYTVSPLIKFPYMREARKIKQEEERMMRDADGCIAITPEEKKVLENENKRVSVIPNGVDLSYFAVRRKPQTDKKTLLFVGDFSYFPNVEGFKNFYSTIYPKLQGSNYEVLIVGKHFEKCHIALEKNMRHIDFIADIRDAYSQADIFISPLRIGGGTNFKILEAMASGVPVIAMRKTGQSIGAEQGKEILLADNDSEFTENIFLLAKNAKKREMLSRQGRSFIEKNYAWEKIGTDLSLFWQNI